ncbi:uncharacterized protein HD556DRAFT_1343679 [Suillus plorans]|uniref:Uncharacterized protein n=1 Tax=Suillus plorans TaxID=116603 RepID=A0A9P7DQ93_9AGAM|nr:uncharacterized protein HD556DRAFT_1343679 [Suillus plorans]KAG1800432.1 hypothetical protein HD556DRAFT_1343679 [Suillus plorans]
MSLSLDGLRFKRWAPGPSPISHFSPSGLVFDDGSRVVADLVIFATGYSKCLDANSTTKQMTAHLWDISARYSRTIWYCYLA